MSTISGSGKVRMSVVDQCSRNQGFRGKPLAIEAISSDGAKLRAAELFIDGKFGRIVVNGETKTAPMFAVAQEIKIFTTSGQEESLENVIGMPMEEMNTFLASVDLGRANVASRADNQEIEYYGEGTKKYSDVMTMISCYFPEGKEGITKVTEGFTIEQFEAKLLAKPKEWIDQHCPNWRELNLRPAMEAARRDGIAEDKIMKAKMVCVEPRLWKELANEEGKEFYLYGARGSIGPGFLRSNYHLYPEYRILNVGAGFAERT